ncbi:MAG TPA: hypothetical protein VGG92_07075 [Caulobacteraceae bacterium]
MQAVSALRRLAILATVFGLGVLIVRQAQLAGQRDAPPRFCASDPLDERALAELGFQADRRGDRARARRLIGLASRRSWRDPRVQTWLLQRAVEAGDWTGAMAHADALLRVDPDGALRPAVFRLLDVIAADDTSRPALIERLRSAPWWRRSWLAQLADVAVSPGGAVTPDQARAIVIGLASGTEPLSAAEYQPYLDMRLARGDYALAERDWGLLAGAHDADALLRDPTFQTLGDAGPFAWRGVSGAGASIEAEATVDGGRALRVDYDGASSPVLTGQLLVLPPGRYSFVWRERILGPPRIVWRLRCLGPAPRILTQGSPLDAPGWRARALAFETTKDCPAQELELVPQPAERRDEVSAWFADLSLSRRS